MADTSPSQPARSSTDQFATASFTADTGKNAGKPVLVHFNPVSLQYSVNNIMRTGRGTQTQQYVSRSTAKLSMDLIFDTTNIGQDVREITEQIAFLMEPNNQHVPPRVTFKWGVYTFKGIVDSYKETLDFFSSSGVPLRATVNVSLTKQELVFQPSAKGATQTPQGSLGNLMNEAVDLPPSNSQSPSDAARQAGNDRAASEIARTNGLESVRAPSTQGLTLANNPSSSPPAAFSSAGRAATQEVSDIFSNLRTPQRSHAQLDLDRLRPTVDAVSIATDAGASFQMGGQALQQASSSQRTDVGANISLKDMLEFDEDT